MTTRSKTRASAASTSVAISHSELDSPGEQPARPLRLTLKMPAGKLREATGGPNARRSVNVFRENPIVSGPRASRNKRRVVEVPTDDEDIEDQEEDEVDDEDAPGEDDEDEDEDADGDLDMDDAPPQPPVRRAAKAAAPARTKGAKSVEAKEMELELEDDEDDDDEDDDLSETDSDAEGEPDDEGESAIPDVNVDDLDEEDEEDDLVGELDSDAMALDSGKQTKRQRGNLGNDFLQLPMGGWTLPVLSLSEHKLTGDQSPK